MLSSKEDSNLDYEGDERKNKTMGNTQDQRIDDFVDEEDGLIEADDDYEEYFFKDQGEHEQYVKVVGDNRMMSGMSGDGLSNQGPD